SGIVTAPHLHYEIRFIHQYLNPAPFMAWSPEHHESLFQEKSVKWLSLLELMGSRTQPTRALSASAKLESPPTPSRQTVVTAHHPLRPQTPK
ncbi:MAG: hypothetical protein HQM00_07940, partial [Magnetococcales bacterium]|nr:hypothetical protein [Magnetococcales bacterium]